MFFKIIKIILGLIGVLLSSAVAGLVIFIIVKIVLKINQIF
ncbi:hypothetical protein SIXOD_v1c26280 [Spiroplasma ixodetis Y32]|nr:hypothetical protein SIXOD_v1c01700 [Spiroplasma ixodetis Y32]WJG70460.1 hypothetical protein SIXOD_v1c16200 [Spiroplasma ixodetis Y32]WJG70625.1 hypothetical protein SIXOD_v1c18170 [Spiroplasma ixodetis Y32]WJG70675.1 hypothetical protein SIXOD_v1c18840 [Spiroplasma ixodetis Y32]WJG70886.1 hypothetical protein SIXOD_v1c21710 [Spiroplasma ixodetis Y32]